MSHQQTAILSLLLISMALTQNIGAPVIKISGAVSLEYGGLCPRPSTETNGMFLNCAAQGE
jgi:hypothetical protein